MPHITVDDMQLYYEEHGSPAGPCLVLLHGFISTGASWKAQLQPLGAYRLLVPDWRGHGRTNNPGGPAAMTHRQFARDAAAFCRALGVESAAFCGHSSGAMQLLYLALEAPALVRALVLCGGSYFYSDELRAWWREQTPETVLSPERISAEQAKHTAMGPDHWHTVTAAWIALGGHAHEEDFPPESELHRIAAPALVVHGDRDRYFPVEVPAALYRLLPDAELCLLPNTGHVPHQDHPDWFNAVALDFLARRYPAAPA